MKGWGSRQATAAIVAEVYRRHCGNGRRRCRVCGVRHCRMGQQAAGYLAFVGVVPDTGPRR